MLWLAPQRESCQKGWIFRFGFSIKTFKKLYLFHGGRLRTRVLKLELRQRVVARSLLLIDWHNVVVFAMHPAERLKYYMGVPDTWSDWVPLYNLFVPMPRVLLYYSGEVLKKSRVGSLATRIAEAEFVVSTLVCFLRCAQFGASLVFTASRMRAMQHDCGFLPPLPTRMREAIDSVGLFLLFRNCDMDVARDLVAFGHVRELGWRDSQCAGLFPYEFESWKVLTILANEVTSGKQGRDCDRHVTVERKVWASYLEKFREKRMSLRFAEVAFERYLVSGTDLYDIPNLVNQRRIMDDEVGEDAVPEVTVDEGDWDFEGLVTAEKF